MTYQQVSTGSLEKDHMALSLDLWDMASERGDNLLNRASYSSVYYKHLEFRDWSLNMRGGGTKPEGGGM